MFSAVHWEAAKYIQHQHPKTTWKNQPLPSTRKDRSFHPSASSSLSTNNSPGQRPASGTAGGQLRGLLLLRACKGQTATAGNRRTETVGEATAIVGHFHANTRPMHSTPSPNCTHWFVIATKDVGTRPLAGRVEGGNRRRPQEVRNEIQLPSRG